MLKSIYVLVGFILSCVCWHHRHEALGVLLADVLVVGKGLRIAGNASVLLVIVKAVVMKT